MARAVLPDEPRAIHREDDRHVVLADVVHHLIECPLEERGVQRHHRPKSTQRQTGRERHRVLLGDADVEDAIRELRSELRHPGARRHAGRDAHDPSIGTSQVDKLGGEHGGVVGVLRWHAPPSSYSLHPPL